MDLGRGESVALPDEVREAWWRGTTRQWPFIAADLSCSMETIMAHYMSNHIAVAYGDIFEELVALGQLLGIKVRVLSSHIFRSQSRPTRASVAKSADPPVKRLG